MDLPKIDIASLPGLEAAQGLFGSATQAATSYDDRIVEIMVFIYNTIPPQSVV